MRHLGTACLCAEGDYTGVGTGRVFLPPLVSPRTRPVPLCEGGIHFPHLPHQGDSDTCHRRWRGWHRTGAASAHFTETPWLPLLPCVRPGAAPRRGLARAQALRPRSRRMHDLLTSSRFCVITAFPGKVFVFILFKRKLRKLLHGYF